MRTNIKMILNITIVIAIAITVVISHNALVTATIPTIVIAQEQNLSTLDKQLITEAVLEDDRRNNSSGANIAPLQVEKIAITNSYALATTIIGEHGGGVAVLSKKQGKWRVVGGGGGWLILKDLESLGIPRNSARVLLKRIDSNWRNYEPQ